MMLRHGQVVAEGWWAPYGPDRVHLLYSLSKSFTSTAAGFAVAEGLLDLDATVLSYFPEFDADITDPRSRVDAGPPRRGDGQRPHRRRRSSGRCGRTTRTSRSAGSC